MIVSGRPRWQALILPLLLVAAPVALADEFPRDGAAAMAYYEADVAGWLQGPVQYIALDAERRSFERLDTDAQRAAFIEWFWARRDDDRDLGGNAFRTAFYERVAEANSRYHDFPRGWRSDRGRVHVVLGRPDAIRPQVGRVADATTWTYYTVGPQARNRDFGTVVGEISIVFVRAPGRDGYRIYGSFGGVGDMPLYVRDAIDFTVRAAIADPSLSPPPTN